MLKQIFQTRENLYLCILYLILLIPNLFVLFYFQEISGSISMLVAYFILSILVWIFPLLFLPKKVFFGISFLFLLLAPLEIIFVKSLGIPITEGFIEAIYRTNYSESMEQVSSNFKTLILYFSLIVVYIFFYLKIENTFLHRNFRVSIAVLFLLFNGVLFLNMYRIQTGEQQNFSHKLKTAWETTLMKYYKIYPANIILNTSNTITHLRTASALEAQLEQFTFEAKSNNEEKQEEIYVLVIGETARYSNFHINNYHRKTTPNLDSISNLLSYSNVYSNANLTSISIPMIITRAKPENRFLQYKEKSILDAFKEAGFYTAWLANQSSEYPTISRLRNSADLFISKQFSTNVRGFYDEEILPEFENALDEKENKKFIVIHTLGSHFRYTNRYPEKFEKFTPVMKGFGYSDFNYQHKEEIVNSYDNSILYTDFFLSQVIHRLKKTRKNAILLYVSDHGENLFDDENKFIGHGTTNPTKFEYHTPYFIWYSDSYKQNNPGKIKQLEKNLHVAASSTITFYTLLDMANITYHDSEKEKIYSLSSDQYQVPAERLMINSAGEVIKLKD